MPTNNLFEQELAIIAVEWMGITDGDGDGDEDRALGFWGWASALTRLIKCHGTAPESRQRQRQRQPAMQRQKVASSNSSNNCSSNSSNNCTLSATSAIRAENVGQTARKWVVR